MKLPELSVKRPVATAMVFLAVLLFGLVALRKLALDIMPELELPTLTVITVYPGASATEVEKQVSKVLESVLAGAENLKDIHSSSRENVSFVSLQYNWGADITSAANNARDLMELTKSKLPENARNPVIFKVNSSMMPVLIYSITAAQNYNGLDKIIDEKISSPLRKVKGVGSVMSLGQPVREIKVNIDPSRLKSYNLSLSQVSAIVKAENISIPGGNIMAGNQDYALRIPGEIGTVEQLGNVPVTNMLGKLVRLKDISTIVDGFSESDEYARTSSGLGAAIMIQKQSGENSLQVIENVKKKMAELMPGLPPDVKVDQILTQEEIVRQSVSNLTETIWWALLFVILVVIAFLRDWKSSLIIFLTVPFSLITAFIVMYAIGWTINIFSLLSLVIAIGMVVDDAIVVLENISRHIEKGSTPARAAVEATAEMGLAITASTLTTVIVFVPLIFVGGIVGILFKQLALLTSVTLLASLITALSLTPMVSSLMLKSEAGRDERKRGRLFEASEKLFRSVESAYKNLLKKAVNNKKTVIALFIIILLAALFTGSTLESDYIPNFDAGDLVVVFKTDIASSSAETDRVATRVMEIMKKDVPEMAQGTLVSISGQTKDGLLTSVGFSEGKNVGTVMCHLSLPDKRKRSASEIGQALRKDLAEVPEISKFHVSAGNILESAILGNKKPVEVTISGMDLDRMNLLADEIKSKLEKINGMIDVEAASDNEKQDYEVIIDRNKASQAGLNSALIALQVRQSIYGTEGGSMTENGDDYDIRIRYDSLSRTGIEKIGDISLTSLLGKQLKLSDVADIRQGHGPLEIERQSQQRVVFVKADLKDMSLGKAKEITSQIISGLNIPDDIDIKLEGQVSSQNESFSDLYVVLVLGIILVYMVMAAQFESFKNPFIIMLALPFTLIGVVLAFKLTSTTLSVTTFIGIIMLVGIAVKNGIILVDYTNQLISRGYSLNEAIGEAGRSRLRPVLMTSFTAIFAMIPMAVSRGMGREMFSPMGITIIGGLLVSTLITLVLVPVLYAIFNKNRIKEQEAMLPEQNINN